MYSNFIDDYLNQGGMFNQILIVNRLKIEKEYRGRNLGLLLIEAFLRQFSSGGESICLLIASPLDFSCNEANKKEFIQARKKLYSYYSCLGFKPVQGDIQVLALETKWKRKSTFKPQARRR